MKYDYDCTHFDEVDNHVPLPAIRNKVLRDEVHHTVLQNSVRSRDDILQVIIAFVQPAWEPYGQSVTSNERTRRDTHLSQKNRYACESSNSSRFKFSMT